MTLRRPDWLDELHGLLLVALIAAGLGTVVGVVALLSGQSIDAEVAVTGAVTPDLPSGIALGSSVGVEILHPSAGQVAWALTGMLPRQVLILATLALLWRAVGQARRADPFGPGMARSFHRLGLVLVLGGPVVWIVDFFARTRLSDSVGVGGTYAVLDFLVPLAWGFAGFGAFAIGEILRRGRAMRVELDGVV
ncbi:hypothetical protein GCM10010168_26090 [Actinoplanes ianthinogenes]|uniref:DUF2975 domain-containing protein n=1 Tax=Actinoplanes ianthinogenes TaxID=122358 RepID=A0ABN6CWM4_9ACTN|nr:DUF2975 domain-containing protein [Actinoplanes ianthinogenes]BCJ48249.1 hypothetical protein Aiant_89060 [Actinoplanes ianthinogenes]GGR07424.1 hypothetical protein GCM10010168_26090 [Actinoplanes ianthinogenes]